MSDAPAKRKGGAPSKYSEALAKVICCAIADGVPITHCATLAQVSFQSICEWRRRFPEFDAAIREAFAKGIQSRLAIVKKAMESKDEAIALRAACWLLTHCPGSAEHFSESRRVEITGDGSAANVIVYLPTKDGEGGGARVVAIDTRKELINGNGNDE